MVSLLAWQDFWSDGQLQTFTVTLCMHRLHLMWQHQKNLHRQSFTTTSEKLV